MDKLFTFGYYILIAGILIIAILLGASMFPIPGNFDVKIVLSGSMEPAIPTGSLVVIKPSDTYHVGDVITFGGSLKNNVPTTHRIVKVRAESGEKVFITKGDANAHEDSKEVREKDIVGKVVLLKFKSNSTTLFGVQSKIASRCTIFQDNQKMDFVKF